MNNKEILIQSVVTAMSTSLDGTQLQLLENILHAKLHGLRLEEECTYLSTWQDDNEYIMKVFYANKKLDGVKDNSLYQYLTTVKHLFHFLNKNYRDIRKEDLKYYLAVRSQQVKPNTLLNERLNLSNFFTFLHQEGYIQTNPMRGFKGIKKQEVETIYLSLDEEVSVRDVPKNLREQAMIDLLFSTGVRVGELVAMNIKDIDFEAGTVTFRGEKSDRIRTVVLDARAKRHVLNYLNSRNDNDPALFVSERLYNGSPRRLSRDAAEKITKRVGYRAGLKFPLTVHVFRRTFATRMADRGCPLETLQELMGHANPATTKIYIAKSKTRVQRAAARYMDVA